MTNTETANTETAIITAPDRLSGDGPSMVFGPRITNIAELLGITYETDPIGGVRAGTLRKDAALVEDQRMWMHNIASKVWIDPATRTVVKTVFTRFADKGTVVTAVEAALAAGATIQ